MVSDSTPGCFPESHALTCNLNLGISIITTAFIIVQKTFCVSVETRVWVCTRLLVCMYGGLSLIFSICLDHFLPATLSQGLPLEPRAYQVSQSYQPTCPGDPLSHLLPSTPGMTGMLLCSPSFCGGAGGSDCRPCACVAATVPAEPSAILFVFLAMESRAMYTWHVLYL